MLDDPRLAHDAVLEGGHLKRDFTVEAESLEFVHGPTPRSRQHAPFTTVVGISSRFVLEISRASDSFGSKELIDPDSCLSNNGAQCSFRHIPRVTRHGDFPAGGGVAPDFVAPRSRSVERITKVAEASSHLSIPESGEPAH